MKSRSGFVSNSSSCSFVLVVKKSDRDEWIKTLDPIQKALMERFEDNCNQEFCGEEIAMFSGEIGYIDEDGNYEIIEALGDDFTDDEKQELEDYPWDDQPVHKKFRKKYGYNPCLSEAFQKIDLPEDSIYVETD